MVFQQGFPHHPSDGPSGGSRKPFSVLLPPALTITSANQVLDSAWLARTLKQPEGHESILAYLKGGEANIGNVASMLASGAFKDLLHGSGEWPLEDKKAFTSNLRELGQTREWLIIAFNLMGSPDFRQLGDSLLQLQVDSLSSAHRRAHSELDDLTSSNALALIENAAELNRELVSGARSPLAWNVEIANKSWLHAPSDYQKAKAIHSALWALGPAEGVLHPFDPEPMLRALCGIASVVKSPWVTYSVIVRVSEYSAQLVSGQIDSDTWKKQVREFCEVTCWDYPRSLKPLYAEALKLEGLDLRYLEPDAPSE